MLKDINGNINITSFNNEIINDIEELFELMSYRYDTSKYKIIGFVKFNPFLRSDNRFCNILDRKSWYPVIRTTQDLFIEIIGVNQAHFGLFESIVAVDGYQKHFKQFLNTEKRVIKYWKKKNKEKRAIEIAHIELQKQLEEEKKILNAFNSELGKRVPRKTTLTNFLKGKTNESRLFEKLDDSKWKSELINDINYRLNKISLVRKFKNHDALMFVPNKYEYKFEEKLLNLLDSIENPKIIETFKIKLLNTIKKYCFFL